MEILKYLIANYEDFNTIQIQIPQGIHIHSRIEYELVRLREYLQRPEF